MSTTEATTLPIEPAGRTAKPIDWAALIRALDAAPGLHVFLVAPRTEQARHMFTEFVELPEVQEAVLELDARLQRTRGMEVLVWPNGSRVRPAGAFEHAFGDDPVHVAVVAQGPGYGKHAIDAIWAAIDRTAGEVRILDHVAAVPPAPSRRTKRLYAHELHPRPLDHEHLGMDERRPLTREEVAYLYARVFGFSIQGTGALDAPGTVAMDRAMHLQQVAHVAFLADALAQDLVGQEAWEWAHWRSQTDEIEAIAWERAVLYGVDPSLIKPYPSGPDRDWHLHPNPERPRYLVNAVGREEDCLECTEPIPEATALSPDEWAAVEHFGFDRPETTTEHEEHDHA